MNKRVVASLLTLSSHAKINLYIDVLYKRGDGYHQVEMIMQKLLCHDLLTMEKADEIIISCSDLAIPTDQTNLVHKAIGIVAKDYPEVKGLSVAIEKMIPAEAGLAGGSSNAATAIEGISKLYDLQLSKEQMAFYGQQVGSDVSFFFYGATSLATGRGEIIRDLVGLPPLYVVLLKPAEGLSTAEVYKNLVIADSPQSASAMAEAISEGNVSFVAENLYNKLEDSSFELLPPLRKIKETLVADNPASLMSGSGSTFFSLFTNKEDALTFMEKHRNSFDFCTMTRFLEE